MFILIDPLATTPRHSCVFLGGVSHVKVGNRAFTKHFLYTLTHKHTHTSLTGSRKILRWASSCVIRFHWFLRLRCKLRLFLSQFSTIPTKFIKL